MAQVLVSSQCWPHADHFDSLLSSYKILFYVANATVAHFEGRSSLNLGLQIPGVHPAFLASREWPVIPWPLPLHACAIFQCCQRDSLVWSDLWSSVFLCATLCPSVTYSVSLSDLLCVPLSLCAGDGNISRPLSPRHSMRAQCIIFQRLFLPPILCVRSDCHIYNLIQTDGPISDIGFDCLS